jgi:hypothetical protein
MFRSVFRLAPLWLGLAFACGADAADPMPTAFTYQGELRNAGVPVNGTLQVFITPYPEPQGGAPLAPTVDVDGVPAVDGLFSLPVDFGPGFFVGDDVWLEIGVRVNGGDQQVLSPRQQVTPAPYALKVRLNSVTGLEIQDGEVGAADLAAGSVVAGKIGTDAVTATAIAAGAVGADELATAAVTTAKLADGAVTGAKVADATLTAADLADTSVGTAELAVASVTSPKLADGAVGTAQLADASVTGAKVADGSLGTADLADNAVTTPDLANASVTAPKLADGAVTATKIAIGAVGAAQVDLSQVQARLTANCPPGMSLRGIGSGGTAICNNALSYPVSDGVYGRGALALRADGRPVFTGLDLGTGQLRLGQCVDPGCAAVSYTVLDTPGTTGEASALAIRPDGRPVVAYGITVSGTPQLRLRVCDQAACATSAIVTLDASGAYTGGGVSIALRADGTPLVGYRDSVNADLRAYICDNPACSSGQPRLIEGSGDTGEHNAAGWSASGFPLLSYFNATQGQARLYVCGNASCSAGIARILGTASAGMTRFVVRANGRPLVAWHDVSGASVVPRVYDCSDADCLSGTLTPLPAVPGGSGATSIAIAQRANGNPVLAYGRTGRASSIVYQCINATCSAGTAFEPLSPASYGGGGGLGLALRGDERPVLLLDAGLVGGGHLLAICGSIDCSSPP